MKASTFSDPSVVVLVITNNDDSGACIIVNGKIVAAAQEEGFSRIKVHKSTEWLFEHLRE